MDSLNSLLSVVIHVFIALLLVIYLPFSLLCKLLRWVFLRLFSIQEDMRGKVVLITGASSGIGEQLVYQYAKRGASLAVLARRAQALHIVAKNARDGGAPDVLVIVIDVSNADASKQAVEETIAHFGRHNVISHPVDHLVVNAGVWSTCLLEEVTSITAFNQVTDLNFWGSVYPTYYSIPHLKRSHGRIIVNASIAGRISSPRMTFYTASKAALVMFYESLRSEVGSNIGITLVTLGYVESELTKGKAIQSNGELGINEEARDIQIGPFPIGGVEKCAKIIVDGACRGDKYITWPSWYKPLALVSSLAPELVDLFSQYFYMCKAGDGSGVPLGKKILDVMGLKKFLYPHSVLSPSIKTEKSE